MRAKKNIEYELPEQIATLLWRSPQQALNLLQKKGAIVSAKKTNANGIPLSLIEFIARVMLQQFEQVEQHAGVLLKKYEQQGDKKNAAMVHQWLMFAYIVMGNLVAANRLQKEFEKKYTKEEAPEAYLHFYIFSCFYADKNGYFEDYIRLCNEAEALSKQVALPNLWKNAIIAIGKLFKSRAYSNYHRFDDAKAILDEVKTTADELHLSVFVQQQILINETIWHELSGKRNQAILAMQKIEKMLEGQPYFQTSYATALCNILHLYNLQNIPLSPNDPSFLFHQKQQKSYVKKAEQVIKPADVTGTAGFYYYAKSWFMFQLGNDEEAIRAVARSIRIFYRLYQYRFLAQAYTLAYSLYSKRARQSKSYIAAFKAARSSERMRQMSDAYYKQLLKERIEAVELSFAIKEKELNEKIMQQKMEAMNNEIQMTKINLHEKIMVLDELKTYVHSLKKKELETRQLINTIAKKIDAVKITEEDKAVLQQKISESNRKLEDKISALYPSLTQSEVRMCGIIITGLTNKELSKLFGLTEKAYEQQRYRIKKKMGLGAEVNLVKHLVSLLK